MWCWGFWFGAWYWKTRRSSRGRPSVLHGALMGVLKMLMDKSWKPSLSQLVTDYPGVGPTGTVISTKSARATYDSITDRRSSKVQTSVTFGRVSALESSHAIALAQKVAAKMSPDQRTHRLPLRSWGTRTLCRLENVSKLKQKGNKPWQKRNKTPTRSYQRQ